LRAASSHTTSPTFAAGSFALTLDEDEVGLDEAADDGAVFALAALVVVALALAGAPRGALEVAPRVALEVVALEVAALFVVALEALAAFAALFAAPGDAGALALFDSPPLTSE
jgi:hypothetical protein